MPLCVPTPSLYLAVVLHRGQLLGLRGKSTASFLQLALLLHPLTLAFIFFYPSILTSYLSTHFSSSLFHFKLVIWENWTEDSNVNVIISHSQNVFIHLISHCSFFVCQRYFPLIRISSVVLVGQVWDGDCKDLVSQLQEAGVECSSKVFWSSFVFQGCFS